MQSRKKKMLLIALGALLITTIALVSSLLQSTEYRGRAQAVTGISFVVGLHGIGKGGDNVNPDSIATVMPLRLAREITIKFFNADNQLVATKQASAVFTTDSGMFAGVAALESNFVSGIYTVQISAPHYLSKTIPGIISIISGQTVPLPQVKLVTGDSNSDNQLSIIDYNLLLDCFSDLSPARSCNDLKKIATDLTDDGNVNQFDYNLFLRELSVQGGDGGIITPGSPTGTPTPTQSGPSPTLSSGVGTVPAQVLDLTNWKITLPTGSSGSPTEIKQPALATFILDPWFIVGSGNTVRFRAPVNGVTTSGSSYPRSELREMTNNGTTNAAWSSTAGTHTMFIEEAITAIPQTKKHVVAGQIHDGSDDVIVIRLEFPKLFIDINGADGPILDANYALGRKFTVRFVVNNGQTAIFYNGNSTPAYTLNKNYSSAYFKAGAYPQSNCSTEGSSTFCNVNNFGEVVLYQLTVTHQ